MLDSFLSILEKGKKTDDRLKCYVTSQPKLIHSGDENDYTQKIFIYKTKPGKWTKAVLSFNRHIYLSLL